MLWTRLFAVAATAAAYVVNEGTNCTLYPESSTHHGRAVDDGPSIHQAFDLCGINGTVVFTNHTFHVNSVLNTTNLRNCHVKLLGELRFSTNIPYWRSHSFSVELQNQVTAWLFGGTNVSLHAAKGGFINGQGQAWYDENKNQANQPGRPISITVFNSTNVSIDGLRILQPQFWASFVSRSRNVSLTNFYVSAVSDSQWLTVNSDGYDSWNSHDLLVQNATVISGDDCVAAKGNTTNLLVQNVTCVGVGYRGSTGMTIGSVGQYPKTPDYVENVTFRDVRCHNCLNGAYIKSWQGSTNEHNLNGDVGGGGSGYVKNVTFENFVMTNVSLPILVSQCIYSQGTGSCNDSKIQIEDVTWRNITGTSAFNIAASLYCAAERPCPRVRFEDVNIRSRNETLGLPAYNTTLQYELFQCANIVGQNKSGIPCNRKAPDNINQLVFENVREEDGRVDRSVEL